MVNFHICTKKSMSEFTRLKTGESHLYGVKYPPVFLDSTFKGLKALFGFNGILLTLDYESSAGLLNWAV